jgi:hypothetical protein
MENVGTGGKFFCCITCVQVSFSLSIPLTVGHAPLARCARVNYFLILAELFVSGHCSGDP